MKLVYSRRALADLDRIAAYYATNASPTIAENIEHRLSNVIARICQAPEAAPRVSQRSQARVVAVIRDPFQIFTGCAMTQSIYCIFDILRDGP
jgi:toxin ParE1/3/4